MDREICCAFTGHREGKLPWHGNELDGRCLRLKQSMYEAVRLAYTSGKRHFLCGMATGCDTYFCETLIRLRQEKRDVTIEAAIPWEGQSLRWSEKQRRRYHRLVSECDYQTVVQSFYSDDCMMRRNRYMVDSASLLIAAYDGKAGGTRNTMLYAMRQGVEVVELPV